MVYVEAVWKKLPFKLYGEKWIEVNGKIARDKKLKFLVS